MNRKYYIAYGSNLNMKQMRMRCPTAQVIGTAEIKGYELLFKGSQTGAYLTIEPKIGGTVPVAIWSVTKKDEMALDHYEGFPTFYYKKEMKLPIKFINSKKKEIKNCFVYIMHEERNIGIPYPGYIRVCLEGYRTFGFDEYFLQNAYLRSKEAKEWKKDR